MNINPTNNISFGVYTLPKHLLDLNIYSSASYMPRIEDIEEPEDEFVRQKEELGETTETPEGESEDGSIEEIMKFFEAESAIKGALQIEDISDDDAFLDAMLRPREDTAPKVHPPMSQVSEIYKARPGKAKRIDVRV